MVMYIAAGAAIVADEPLPKHTLAEHHMGMPAIDTHRWTADEVRALPEEQGKRFECVDGDLLVSPGPRWPHQRTVYLLSRALDDFCHECGIGSMLNGPADIELDQYTLVQPDVFVMPLVDGRHARFQEETGHPLLFVEVLSPSTAQFDRVIKRVRYQRFGVEFWIVDVDARQLERWMPDSEREEIVTGSLTWHPAGAEHALTINLDALFADALGER